MKTLKTLLAATPLMLGAFGPAHAVQITFDLFKPGTATQIVNDATIFDWASNGSAVVKGAGPFGNGVVLGETFDVLLQTTLAGFENFAGPIPNGDLAPGLNGLFAGGGYEITAVAKFTEIVIVPGVNNATFAVIPGSGTVSIYYDDSLVLGGAGGTKANLALGTGYDDGKLLYEGTIIGGGSLFGLTSPTAGNGSVNPLLSTTNIIDGALVGVSGNLALALLSSQGSVDFPPGNSCTTNFHIGGNIVLYPGYVADFNCAIPASPLSDDLVLKFDGSASFIPEPGTLALLGAVLLGAGLGARRRHPRTTA